MSLALTMAIRLFTGCYAALASTRMSQSLFPGRLNRHYLAAAQSSKTIDHNSS